MCLATDRQTALLVLLTRRDEICTLCLLTPRPLGWGNQAGKVAGESFCLVQSRVLPGGGGAFRHPSVTKSAGMGRSDYPRV